MELLSTVWDYIWYALGWLLSWAIVISLSLGLIFFTIHMIRICFGAKFGISGQLDDIYEELKKINSNKSSNNKSKP